MGAGRDGRGPIPTLRPFEKGDLTRNMLVSPWRYTVSTLADIVSCSIIREESTNFDTHDRLRLKDRFNNFKLKERSIIASESS